MRLRYAYFIKCVNVVKDKNTGEPIELHCTYDPATRGGDAPDARKVKATLHWVSALHAVESEVRLYERLFTKSNPEDVSGGEDFKVNYNKNSLEVIRSARIEPAIKNAKPLDRYQFERLGYFCVDLKDSAPGRPVFNRTVTLRDTWAKIEKRINKK